MLGNNDYDTFFANNVISDCNILVVANDGGGLLFDKEHIISFTMTRENECALSFAPNDKVVIEVINWNTLSEGAKSWLSKPTTYDNQNFVWLLFNVNNERTTYGICLAIEKVEINTKKWRAKLTFCSPFKTMTDLTTMWGLTNGFNTFPNGTTEFEAIQHEAVNLGKGLVIPNYQDYYWFDYDTVDLTRNTIDVKVNKLNITSDIVESEDDNDRSNIEFVGIKVKGISTLHTQYKQPTPDLFGNLELIFDPFDFEGKQFVITGVKVFLSHAGTDVTSDFNYSIYADKVTCRNKTTATLSAVNYELVVEGYEAELDVPASENYVKSYTWLTGSQGLADAQAKTRAYYSHNKYYEFDCRLDPRIEPLDNIFIEDIGVIKVEKVTMKYKGAFNGHIKGRLIQDTTLLNPVIKNIGYSPSSAPTSFHFDIVNNNPVEVGAYVIYSSGSYVFAIPANSTLTVTQAEAPNLIDSFVAYASGSLVNEVVCGFEALTSEWDDSELVTILEES